MPKTYLRDRRREKKPAKSARGDPEERGREKEGERERERRGGDTHQGSPPLQPGATPSEFKAQFTTACLETMASGQAPRRMIFMRSLSWATEP